MVRLRLAALGIAASLAGASSGASAPDAAPAPAPFRWDGLERRNPGLLVFRSRWDPGTLELRDDLVRWADRKNPGKNLVLPVRRLTGHTLVCRGPAGAPCSEWRLSTKTEVYVFREANAAASVRSSVAPGIRSFGDSA